MRLPSNFDADAFCARGEELRLQINVAELPRLAEECAQDEFLGHLHVDCNGSHLDRSVLPDCAGAPLLEVGVTARLSLACVRCLGPVWVELSFRRQFVLFASDALADNALVDDDKFDAIVGGRHMDLEALVEDEVMMALPEYPTHDVCPPGRMAEMESFVSGKIPETDEEVEQVNPFEVLRKLKKH
jgi:uncharacterized protein